MAHHPYREKCWCDSCRDYRRANDYRSKCTCVDCTMVRVEVCGNSGRVGEACNACSSDCSCKKQRA